MNTLVCRGAAWAKICFKLVESDTHTHNTNNAQELSCTIIHSRKKGKKFFCTLAAASQTLPENIELVAGVYRKRGRDSERAQVHYISNKKIYQPTLYRTANVPRSSKTKMGSLGGEERNLQVILPNILMTPYKDYHICG